MGGGEGVWAHGVRGAGGAGGVLPSGPPRDTAAALLASPCPQGHFVWLKVGAAGHAPRSQSAPTRGPTPQPPGTIGSSPALVIESPAGLKNDSEAPRARS